jgi:guanine deaminase
MPRSVNKDSRRNGAQAKVTAYLGRIITPVDWQAFREFINGALIVDSSSGKIEACGDWSSLSRQYPGADVIDFGPRLILPGFIDLHVHLVQIAQTGRAGDTLLGWLNKYIFPAEMRFTEPGHAHKMADWFFRELAKNGTTLAAVFASVHAEATDIAFQTAAASGMRVIMGKTMMDRNAPAGLLEDAKVSLKQSEDLCKRWHDYDHGRLKYAFTPRFAPTSTQESLEKTGQLWRKNPGTYIQTHLSENVDEIKWVHELFPDASSYFDVYENCGVVGHNCLFAHSIHLDFAELQAMKRTDSSIAHCPSSNFFLKSGIFQYSRVKDVGIKFGLGSDVAAGPEMSIFRVMKDAAYMQYDLWISPVELFYLGTLAGARAVNLDDTIGSLEAGKDADFIVVDPTRKSLVAKSVLDHPTEEVLSALVYVGDDRMVCSTFVRGKAIYAADNFEVPLRVQGRFHAPD